MFFLKKKKKKPELFISPGEQCSHHSLMASLTSRVEMKALEYLRAALMPDHEVCLSAFGIPDPGNQSERSLFVSECSWAVEPKRQVLSGHGLISPRNRCGYLLCDVARTVVERYG